MKSLYFLCTFILLSLFMHLTVDWIVPFCETTSSYWFLSNERKINSNAKILVLGDSQIVTGVTPQLIAEMEGVTTDEVLYLPKPSQQPEGILLESLEVLQKVPKLKKVYVNLSPLNTSKNSVTDANRQLFLSFGSFSLDTITHPLLRKAYFSNVTDLSWKIIIKIFPYFGLSSNINRLVYDPIAQSDVIRRQKEFLYIKESMEKNQGSWVWKFIGDDPTLDVKEEFPQNSSQVLSGKRDLSMLLWFDLIRLWQERGVKVVFLRIPFSPKMEKDILKTKANLVADDFFKKITTEERLKESVAVFDFKSEFLEEYQYFGDLTHLNQKGRDAFAIILKKALFDHTHSSAQGM
ncbi:hypothetical protein [Leptospira bandrabouensis]|uniref:hypothetical protein n=1 Tax=Leptospira bandrabouensis TaxID=2484903 RepID=UPI001EE7D62D|nr:hypothetical protein [Leptospira bandrabouensis]MCG6143213.1 hypothetical protein [Leptospira bandrabouensis]MCG6158873.1 hypothetical protein [Leptospira bandrabouensis]MCG6162808.1 hypothetical protein [Leptospira bandrabouensis]